jgi:hypothetical protein
MKTLLAAVAASMSLATAALAQTPSIDRTYEGAEKLSTNEKIELASKSIQQMKEVLAASLERLKTAREERDMVRVNCVSDRLATLKGLLKISEQAEVGLREAAARKDAELVNHEFTKISLARARAENLRVQVDACIGEANFYTGDLQSEMNVDDDIRDDDPSLINEDLLPFSEPIEPPDRLPPMSPNT